MKMKCFGSPSKPHRCKIVLLDETELIQEIQSSHRGQDILEIVFKHLGLLETVYFGLRYVNPKGYTCWLDATDKVVKQMKGIEVPITFYFGVRFYASDPCKLLEETTRYQFFLQLKQDIQLSRLTVTNELAAQLLAFIIQSELGDFDPRVHHQGTTSTATGAGSSYIAEFRLIGGPVAQSADWEQKVCDLHKQLIGQIPAAVEMQFLERLKWLDLYGCELHPVIAEDANEYFIGLSPHGIIVLKNKLKVANYFWPRIVKIMRKSKYFMIRVIDKESEENTYGFEMASKEASKAIHHSCKEHQEFFKLSQSTAANNGTARRGGTLNKNGSAAKNGGSIVNGGGGGASTANSQRPAPMLVRVPSRRYQRMGLPDGSENTSGHMSLMKREVTGGGGGFENSAFNNSGMSRHNSTPSLMKSGGHFNGSQTRYTTSPYHVTCYDTSMMGTKHERGLFSKSASASPLSVRSAFVSRYDYGSGSTPYISHMKRNTSSLSLQRNGGGPPQQQQNITSNGYHNPHHHHHHHHHRRSHLSDNESEVSKCSRASRHSSRSRTTSKSQCRHDTTADSGTESDSSRKRRHRHRKHRHQLAEQPQLVAWNDVALVEKKGGGSLPRPEISSNGYSHPMAKHAATAASAVVRNLTTYNYGVGGGGGGGGDEMMSNGRIGGGQSRSLVNGSSSSSHPRNTHSSSASNGGFLSSEMKKYITHDPVDSAHLSELEKRDIKYTNVESDSKFYKVRPSTNGGSSYRLPPLPLLSADKTSSPPSQTLVDSYAYSNGNGNGSNSSSNNSNQVPPTRYRFDYHHDKQQQHQQQPLSPMNIASDVSYEGASAAVSKAAERPLPYYGVDSRGGHNNNYSAYDGGGGGGGNGYLDYLGKSQSLAQVSSMNGGFHQQQQNQQNQPTPRVHFQTPHSTTAYFSNHDVFMSAMGATPNNGSNGIHHKDGSAQILPMPLAATRKTHEMSTEL